MAQHPLHDYAWMMLEYIGKPRREIYKEMGHQGAFHWFLGKNSIQFGLCTEATYNELIERYSINKMQGFKAYGELQVIDKAYRRVFNLHDGKKYKSNILEYKKDYNGYHPTQKPVALLEDLIKTYSNEGDTVLDFTMGSGSTMIACLNTNRKGIGIELDKHYFDVATKRINEHKAALDAVF